MNGQTSHNIIALTVHIKGLVQGVGFRPFVYRLAVRHSLSGWVVNGTDGVTLKVEGVAARMPQFIEDLRYSAPPASQIDEIIIDQDMPEGLRGFYIMASQDLSDETSEISPDIAVCPECLADMKSQAHRREYPFINCTNCGPRFSIIRDFPYDRAKTTMEPFIMCSTCHSEYSEVSDRRFHAQPVACNQCGPHYTMFKGPLTIGNLQDILTETVNIITRSGIIALKGTGGFHLMCNAFDERAVNRLRQIKQREGKPFAVMFKNTDSLREYAEISETEAIVLNSWRKPIVILTGKKPLGPGITLGLDTVGVFLPYMPIHYMMFEMLETPAVVLTSGNIAGEPIITDNDQAVAVFSGITDAVITYNREIYNRTDDSVVRITGTTERILRRSRGYAPAPVRLAFDADGILAAGAELSNTFCLGKSNRAYLSQHIGDLKNHETFEFYREAQGRFSQIFRCKPTVMAADMHPDYLSTRFANSTGLETIYVQHHHAHIASCMAENGLDETVMGIAFDGTGYGTDGHIWGSEFLTCDYTDFERHCHFTYMPVPGGDKVSDEPWRMGISLLYMVFGRALRDLDLPLLKSLEKNQISRVIEAIEKRINCPLSSGAGRLFDGISAITGICTHSLFHAEAPMRLESEIVRGIDERYEFDLGEDLSFRRTIEAICRDVIHDVPKGIIAAKFHNTISEASLMAALMIFNKTGIDRVVLSGGTFQNKYLLESLESKLVKNNFVVYTHSKLPCNDGGISLGQLAVAARKRKKKL